MFQIVRGRRCPRCGGWLYVEPDRERLDDWYITCGCCGWETYTRYVHALKAYFDPFDLEV